MNYKLITSNEKIRLMQDKNLLHRLYMISLSGTARMTLEEREQLADMVLRLERKGEK